LQESKMSSTTPADLAQLSILLRRSSVAKVCEGSETSAAIPTPCVDGYEVRIAPVDPTGAVNQSAPQTANCFPKNQICFCCTLCDFTLATTVGSEAFSSENAHHACVHPHGRSIDVDSAVHALLVHHRGDEEF
jgi:hypothetical protein